MMMNYSGIMIFGLHLEVFLMLASGVFYLICAGFLWKPYRQEKNELIGALMAFLIYQAVSMFFMGVEMYTMNMLYSNIAGLAIFIGSAYMLKFPFSSFSLTTRKIVFRGSILILLALFIWFMQTPERQMMLMHFSLWYDIVVNGIVVGGSILLLSLRTTEHWMRIKAFGGSSGVISCCIVANATMLGGAFLTSSVFQFIAPIVILGSVLYARKRQHKMVT